MSMLNEKRAEELLALTTKMIQAPSYSGQENLVVDVMKKFCDEHKFTDIHVDRYGNCICHIKGSKPGPSFSLTAIWIRYPYRIRQNGSMTHLAPRLWTAGCTGAEPPI